MRIQIKLRDYQEKAYNQLNLNGVNLLSICPGGGKTEIGIYFILKNPEFKRVLILTHGTNVLKTQWSERLDHYHIPYTNYLNTDCRIVVTIPQAIKLRELHEFDLMIIDEAHEFYLAETVQKIIEKTHPKCQLLLTGTPSKLINEGLKPIIIPGTEVFQSGFLSNTKLAFIRSDYDIEDDKYNQEMDVVSSFQEKQKDTRSSLKRVIDLMVQTLYDHNQSSIDKTLIAARSIKQANIIFGELCKMGIKALLSTSEKDLNSHMMNAFKEYPTIQVLVVVRRGILGFDMPHLVNIIDFTMSRNVNRIYQLYARVLRKSVDNKQKYYFRMTTNNSSDVDRVYVGMACSLNKLEIIEKYNGTNLKQLPICLPKAFIEKLDNKKSETESYSTAVKVGKPKIDAELLDLVDSFGFFENGESMYFGQVIQNLTKTSFRNWENNMKELISFVDKNKRLPRYSKLDEKKLRSTYVCLRTNHSFSDEYNYIRKICSIKKTVAPNFNLNELKELMKNYPNISSFQLKHRRYYKWGKDNGYIKPSFKYHTYESISLLGKNMYKSDFKRKYPAEYQYCIKRKWLDKICLPSRNLKKGETKYTKLYIKDFIIQNNCKTIRDIRNLNILLYKVVCKRKELKELHKILGEVWKK